MSNLREHPWLVLTLALAFAMPIAGCSGSASDSDDDGANTVDDPRCADEFNGPIDPSALIDDLEDGDGQISQVGDRNGGWWISTDGTDGIITPEPDMQPPAERILGKRCDSEFGMHVTGADFSDWGAVLSLGFRYVNGEESVDISDFSGVMFWAKVGETHSSSIRFQFQDKTTHAAGGLCDDQPGSDDECWDGWGTELAPIGTEWQLYKLRFKTLAQRDYGLQGDAFDLEHVYNIDVSMEPNSVFDFWIDDLWFFE